MSRYFFDVRIDGQFFEDRSGLEFDSLEDVEKEAAMSLADMVRDVSRGTARHALSLEVRDETQPVLTVVVTLETILRSNLEKAAVE